MHAYIHTKQACPPTEWCSAHAPALVATVRAARSLRHLALRASDQHRRVLLAPTMLFVQLQNQSCGATCRPALLEQWNELDHGLCNELPLLWAYHMAQPRLRSAGKRRLSRQNEARGGQRQLLQKVLHICSARRPLLCEQMRTFGSIRRVSPKRVYQA